MRTFRQYFEAQHKEIDMDGLFRILERAVEHNYADVMRFFSELGNKSPHVQDELDAYRLSQNQQATQGSTDMPKAPAPEVAPSSADQIGSTEL